MPASAFVLAAGLGTRMRAYDSERPKPLVRVGGKPLIDYALDALAAAGVARAVVNVHYLADALERHLAARTAPQIVISDERDALLGTGGGIVKALPKLGEAPFFLINSDTLWRDAREPNLGRLARAFDAAAMDALLLLAPRVGSIGYHGSGDFALQADRRLRRPGAGETAPYVYAGAAILAPALFAGAPGAPHALTLPFENARMRGRLFGLPLTGTWIHVGTPEAVAAANAALAPA